MPCADIVVYFFYFETSLLYKTYKVLRMIHLAIAVCHCSEVDTCLSQHIQSRLELLPIHPKNDRRAVEEVTAYLRQLDPQDPVKYDFALFGEGVFDGKEM